MRSPLPSNDKVEISSDDSLSSSSSDGDNDVFRRQQLNDESRELAPEAWLLRKAESYQEYMKLIPIPNIRGTVIPYTSWTGLGSSIKQIYGQPLHYLTNLHLKCMDQERIGAENTHVPLYMIIHPSKAEASIWIIEEAHRLTSSPHHLTKLWAADTHYHAYIDDIFPPLNQTPVR